MNCECLNCCEPPLFDYQASRPATNNPPVCGGGCVGNPLGTGAVVIFNPSNGKYYQIVVEELDNHTLAPVLEEVMSGSCAAGSTISAPRIAVINTVDNKYYEVQVGSLDNQSFAPVADQIGIALSTACGSSQDILDDIIAGEIVLYYDGDYYRLITTTLDNGTVAPVLEQTPV